MGRDEKRRSEHGHKSETTSFRSLVESKISVDEYVRRLDERVRERHKNEETVRGSRRGDKSSPRL
jgi:hypothetical protein